MSLFHILFEIALSVCLFVSLVKLYKIRKDCQKSILVVEDHVETADSLKQILDLDGHDVDVAYDGQEALDKLEDSSKLDVVLLDINLPKVDGYRVAKALRREKKLKKTIIVAITGSNDKKRSREAGIDHHFTKPIDPELVRRFIRNL